MTTNLPTDLTATTSLQQDDPIKAFKQYVSDRYPEQASNPVWPPYLASTLWPLARADIGIDDERPWDLDRKLTATVQPWPDMQINDRVALYWNDRMVAGRLLATADIAMPLTLKIRGPLVPEGAGNLVLKVQRKAKTNSAYTAVYTSVALKTLAWFDRPGDEDGYIAVDASGERTFVTPCVLDAPVLLLPATGGIGPEQAAQGVKVSVPAYSYMNQYDTIRLRWGGQLIERIVEPGEVETDIVIDISARSIGEAGNGDPLEVWYDVIDEVGNASRAISAKLQVKVQLGAQWLDAPVILDPTTGVATLSLKLEALGTQDVQVEVPGKLLRVGDKVTVTLVSMTAPTAGATPQIPTLEPQEVKRAGERLLFGVPNAHILCLRGGFLQATYAIERKDASLPGSAAAHVAILGEPLKLKAPIVNEATLEDGLWQIDPDLTVFFVDVQHVDLQAGDTVYVSVSGIKADGTPLEGLVKSQRLTIPPADVTLRFLGRDLLKPLQGGWVDVSYRVKRGDAELQSETLRLAVGELLETLPPPGTETPLQGGLLDPSLPVFARGLYITIPELDDVKPPYRLELFFETPERLYQSEQAVGPGERPDVIRVPETELVLGESAEQMDVRVYYMIYQSDKPDRASKDLEFRISRQQDTDADDDLEDYLDDDTDAADETDALFNDFDQYLKRQYPGEGAVSLPRPFIYGAVHPAPTADFAVGGQLIEDYDDQILVLLRPMAQMQPGDVYQLFWGGKLVASRKLKTGEQERFTTLSVHGDDIVDGYSSMYCVIRRRDQIIERSWAVSTLVLREPPGVKGEEGLDQLLSAPEVSPADGVFGQGDGQRKVQVTIAPFLNMTPNSCIHLYWGDELIERPITQAELGKPIVIEVAPGVIAKAGDSNQLPVYYYVSDEAGNESQWSSDATVQVNLLQGSLSRPEVLNNGGTVNEAGVISRSSLGLKPLIIQVHDDDLIVGDQVVVTWIGLTDEGQSTEVTFPARKLSVAGEKLKFELPGQHLEGLSRARIGYAVTRNGVTTQSLMKFTRVEGEAVRLPAPTLKDEEEDWIEASMDRLNVKINERVGLIEGDVVYLRVIGTRSDGEKVILPVRPREISDAWAGRALVIGRTGRTHIKPFDGGYIDVFYEVERGQQTFRSETTRWYVGYLAQTLPAAFPELALPNNTLDPSLAIYENDMGIAFPEEVMMMAPCTVTLFWSTSGGGYYEDGYELEASDEDDEPPMIRIPRAVFDIGEGDGVDVEVYYIAAPVDKPSRASADLEFRIAYAKAQASLLPELKGPAGDKTGTVGIFDVAERGLQVTVPQYPDMAKGDKVVIRFGSYESKPYPVDKVGDLIVNLPPSHILDHARRTTEMSYEVIRADGTKLTSRPSFMNFDGDGAMESFYELDVQNWQINFRKRSTSKLDLVYVKSTVAVEPGNAVTPILDGRSVYARWLDANDRGVPAYRLVLKKPARKLRLHVHGSGTLVVRNSHNQEVFRRNFGNTKSFVVIDPGPGQDVLSLEVSATYSLPSHLRAFGLGPMLLMY